MAADGQALFRVTLGNSISYYQAGPEAKERPGWKGTDKGYVPSDMQFGTDPYSLHDGLLVKLNNGPRNQFYEEFGKQTIDSLVVIERGPVAFVYPPATLIWREASAVEHPPPPLRRSKCGARLFARAQGPRARLRALAHVKLILWLQQN